MLVNACRASGFRLATKFSSNRVTLHRKATYEMCCSHGVSIKMASGYIFDGDDVGASNVRKERIKHVKSVGAMRGLSVFFSSIYQFVPRITYSLILPRIRCFNPYYVFYSLLFRNRCHAI